jgi:hypothetical protein
MNEPLQEHIQVGTRPVEPTHEPLLERVEVLERSLQRWKLISLVLLLILLSGTAISGTFGAVLWFTARDGMRMREVEMMHQEERARAAAARAQAEVARHQAEMARKELGQLQKKGQANQPEPVDP